MRLSHGGQNEHCLGKVRAGTSAEGRMYYDHRGNENNSNRSAGETYRPPRPDLRNLWIRLSRIWWKADKMDNKFSVINDHVTLRCTFGKYLIMIPTGEEWDKDRLNRLRKGHAWFTDARKQNTVAHLTGTGCCSVSSRGCSNTGLCD